MKQNYKISYLILINLILILLMVFRIEDFISLNKKEILRWLMISNQIKSEINCIHCNIRMELEIYDQRIDGFC